MRFKKFYFLLFTLLITISVFNLPVLHSFRNHLKYKIRVDIINKNFKNKEIIIFENSDLLNAKWLEDDEFILNEEMFDVVKKEKIDGKIYYHCFNDSHENKVRKVQEFVTKTFNFKIFEIPEMGVPKMVFHTSQNNFCERIEAGRLFITKIKFSSHKFAVLNCRFADLYYQKFIIPPENYC